jgi:hypothetical protein
MSPSDADRRPAHASASSTNTAGIAGAFSSAKTVHSAQILAFMSVSFLSAPSSLVGWSLGYSAFTLADHAVLTSGQGPGG